MNSIVPSNNSVSAKQAFPFEQEIIQWDLETAIKLTDEQIDKVYGELEILREQKANLETEKLLKDFEDGEYYRLDDRGGCLTYYFKYSKSNFHVQDMTGTVGYTGENDVIISHGLKVFATRAQYQAGFFHSLYLHLSYFHNLSVRKIEAEEFNRHCEQIIKYAEQEKPKYVPEDSDED